MRVGAERKLQVTALLAFAILAIQSTICAPPEPTPIGRAELAAVLRDGHYAAFGRFPSRHRLAVAWAHAALESGQGSRSVGHNIGSVGASGAPCYRVGGARFRAYPSFVASAESYWRVVGRSTIALARFDDGDAMGAARALGRFYHRSDPEPYGRSMRSLMWTFYRDVEPSL